MHKDETNYVVLVLVALVAVVALVTMSVHTTNQLPTTTTTASEQTNILGAATTQAPYNLPAYSRLDYNADGVLDEQDARILADVIGVGGCPEGRICDLNNDGRVDEQDLALFNQLINQPIQRTQRSTATEQQPQPAGQATSTEPRRTTPISYPSQATRLA